MPPLTCRKCGEEKPEDLFHPSRLGTCKRCLADGQRKYRKTRPKGYWRDKDKRYSLKKKYGLSLERYCEMVEEQGGVCAICRQKPVRATEAHSILHVDHCHVTGQVRSLLCNGCNRALGFLNDDPGLARVAAAYLEYHQRITHKG